MLPELPPLPALTRAEADLVDHYLAAIDQLGRVNPTRGRHTLSALQAAQALVRTSQDLRGALATMHGRGEVDLYSVELGRALRVLDGERRTARLLLPPQ